MSQKSYNRDGAITYAAQWCKGHNPRYVDYDNDNNPNTSDCANFVSQCMFEGGGMPMKYTTDVNPYDSWYYNTPGAALTSKSGSWAGANSLRLFIKYNNSGYPRMPYTFLSNSQVGQLQRGDLVFALSGTGDKASRDAKHVGMVSRVVGTTIYVYAHSAAKNDEVWNYTLSDTILCKFDGTILLGEGGSGPSTTWQERYGTPILRKSNTYNAYVQNLQTDLIGEGYSCGSAGADGKYGTGTEGAVKAFQLAYGLSADGVAGNQTKQKLFGVAFS